MNTTDMTTSTIGNSQEEAPEDDDTTLFARYIIGGNAKSMLMFEEILRQIDKRIKSNATEGEDGDIIIRVSDSCDLNFIINESPKDLDDEELSTCKEISWDDEIPGYEEEHEDDEDQNQDVYLYLGE